MKAFLIGLVFIIVVGAGAFVYLKYFYQSPTQQGIYKSAAITKTGELRKTNVTGSDFTHVLISSTEKSVGVASYTLNLDDYIGKQISVTGQYSGDTLYADSVHVIR